MSSDQSRSVRKKLTEQANRTPIPSSQDPDKVPTPRRLRPSIKKDTVSPKDYLLYTLPWACEDCSHFDSTFERCTLGYNPAHHRRAQQKHDYDLGGHYALCRFQEID
jgi:hypothetical protein